MEPFVPEFYEDVHFYPAYRQDGVTPNMDKSFRADAQRRQFATPETAQWVGQLYNAEKVASRPYLGMGEAFDVNEESVEQYYVTIQGVDITAGEIAYYFSQIPADHIPEAIPNDPGYWPADLPIEEVMVRGKEQADKWVYSSIKDTEPTE